MTKTKAQQNYIPRHVAGEQRNVLTQGAGKLTRLTRVRSWTATRPAETKFTQSIKGVKCKTSL